MRVSSWFLAGLKLTRLQYTIYIFRISWISDQLDGQHVFQALSLVILLLLQPIFPIACILSEWIREAFSFQLSHDSSKPLFKSDKCFKRYNHFLGRLHTRSIHRWMLCGIPALIPLSYWRERHITRSELIRKKCGEVSQHFTKHLPRLGRADLVTRSVERKSA